MTGQPKATSRRLKVSRDGLWPEGQGLAGNTVMLGGFGEPGTPFYLIDKLTAEGPDDLIIIKNDANEPCQGVGQLLRAGLVSRMITSHIGLNREMVAAMESGQVTVEFQPQGILAEKIRCGGVGISAFLSAIGVGVLDVPGVAGPEAGDQLQWRGAT